MNDAPTRLMRCAAPALALGSSAWQAREAAASDPRERHLGQTPPGREARVFAPGVVSLDGRHEYAVSLHPDGALLLFSAEAPDAGAAVYCSRLVVGAWSTPIRESLSAGAREHEMEAFFSPDGSVLFFS